MIFSGTRLVALPALRIPTYVLIGFSNYLGHSSGIRVGLTILEPVPQPKKVIGLNPVTTMHPVQV